MKAGFQLESAFYFPKIFMLKQKIYTEVFEPLRVN